LTVYQAIHTVLLGAYLNLIGLCLSSLVHKSLFKYATVAHTNLSVPPRNPAGGVYFARVKSLPCLTSIAVKSDDHADRSSAGVAVCNVPGVRYRCM